MAKQLQILDLPLDLAHHIQTFNFLPVENLDRHLVASQLVEADFDLAEGADAERLPEDVVADLDLQPGGCSSASGNFYT